MPAMGRASMTTMGWRNEPNWEASTMYMKMTDNASARKRVLKESDAICVEPVNTFTEALRDPQALHRGLTQPAPDLLSSIGPLFQFAAPAHPGPAATSRSSSVPSPRKPISSSGRSAKKSAARSPAFATPRAASPAAA